VPGHAGIAGNETADQYAKDAVMPENEAALPSHADRCTSLSHLRRYTTEAKWKRSNNWFELKCRGKKYYRMDKKHNPNQVISRTEKSTGQVYFQPKTGHALIGPYLKRIAQIDDNTCWWCLRGVVQTREHLFKHCTRWQQNQKTLWQVVKSVSGRSMTNTSIKDLLWDRRCSEAVVQYLCTTEIGRRFRERGQQEDDPGGG
jgi:hypothetical protein